MIEYADLECPYCAQAHLLLKRLAITRVFRHFPVVSKHPRARALAAAAEAAGRQGRFWEMHDSLLEDQGHLDDPHLWERAERFGLDVERFEADRRSARSPNASSATFAAASGPGWRPRRPSSPAARRTRAYPGPACLPTASLGAFLQTERKEAMPPTGGG